MTATHFDRAPVSVSPSLRAACGPLLSDLTHLTKEPTAVTCGRCQHTSAYRTSASLLESWQKLADTWVGAALRAEGKHATPEHQSAEEEAWVAWIRWIDTNGWKGSVYRDPRADGFELGMIMKTTAGVAG